MFYRTFAGGNQTKLQLHANSARLLLFAYNMPSRAPPMRLHLQWLLVLHTDVDIDIASHFTQKPVSILYHGQLVCIYT